MGTPLFSSRLNINIATTTHRDCSASPVTLRIHGSRGACDSGCMKAFKNYNTLSNASFSNSSGREKAVFFGSLFFRYCSLARQSLCNICPFYKPSYPIFVTLLSCFFSPSTSTRKLKLYLGLSAASPCINRRDV